MGLRGKVLVAGVRVCVCRGGFCEKMLEAAPSCQTEPVPAGSKMDPLLAKAEPISDGGSASGITYLRRGKSHCAAAIAARERRENM